MKMPDSLVSLDNLATHNSCPIGVPGYFPPKSVPLIIVVCVLTVLLTFSAVTLNFLVLWAIKKTPSLHTPSSVLLFGLALCDFATGVFVQPLFVTHLIASLTSNRNLYCISGAIVYPVGVSLAFVSMSAITAISFDRYLALALHLRYATIITVSRVIKFILITFVLLFPVAIYFWFSREDWFRKTALRVGLAVATVSMLTIPFSYCRIFTILRRHHNQIRSQNRMHGNLHMDISKYRRSVLTILCVLGAILISYVPCGISHMTALFLKREVGEFELHIGSILVLSNSSINPLVYCWRITEIRRFVASNVWRVFGVSGVTNRTVRARQVRHVNNIPAFHD